MRNTITLERLKETRTYRELASKNQQVKMNMLEQKTSREKITHAFLVWKNTRHIPNTVSDIYLSVVKDLIAMSEPDASWLMTAEEINRLNP